MSAESTTFRNDIQGLRALAIVPVVLYHADRNLLPGGFVGVDVFFVISGYLINSILLRRIETGTFSIEDFYAARVRRLFPALYVVLLFSMVVGVVLLPPAELQQLGKTALATALFSSNIVFWKIINYFDDIANNAVLVHTWSLGVEEQFYVIAPIALFLLAKLSKTVLQAALWAGLILSVAFSVWMTRHHPDAAFYLPATRAYELLVGAVLAAGAVPTVRREWLLDTLSVIGLGLILFCVFAYNDELPFPGWIALIPCVGAALIIYAGRWRVSLAGRILSVRPLVFIGGISYSLYLWHWPLLVYLRYLELGDPPTAYLVATIVAAFVLATLSLWFVERPVMRRRVGSGTTIAAGAVTMLIACALIWPIKAHGLPARFAPSSLALFATKSDHNPRRDACHGSAQHPIAYDRNCSFGALGVAPTIVVWGDSFGAELAPELGSEEAGDGRSVMEISASSCPPELGYDPPYRPKCARQNAETLRRLSADPRVRVVALVANYRLYPPSGHASLTAGIGKVAVALAQAHKRVVLIYPVPTMPFSAPVALGLLDHRREPLGGFGTTTARVHQETDFASHALDDIPAAAVAARFLPETRMCTDGFCPAYRAGAGVLYFDSQHLSLSGARYMLAGGLKAELDMLATK